MLSVHILAVGKLKESYLREASAEYQKRLGAFCKLTITEIEEYKLPDRPSEAQIRAGMEEEGKRILQKLPAGCCPIMLCIEGKQLSSEELAGRMAELSIQGVSSIAFVIGGSCGLSDQVKAAARMKLSMSKMTFPHQLARVMLLEQIYRAFSIQAGTRYHK